MSIFKCKMCGGTLEINNNETVGVCEYCGTRQTLPKLDDDRRVNLYDRANHFRRNNEFDKATGIYEQILNEDSTDAEAYWSLVLCRYGIEYVEDPSSHRRIPTVNRAQFTSIFDDDNYKSALQYGDGAQRQVYAEEANAINEIQKGILAISQKEEPFDVFICYKETDNNGRRTQDSVLANDLYHQLTQEGFKVFFSRITLEDKLGTAYEPYIFAALNSAKVMVALGTRPEYFNAVWVKNEWSRYLSLIKNGAKKVLIPAYRDMDPYDLPEEFSHLQAQDMSRLGFMQDLIRGIKKIVQTDTTNATVVKEAAVVGGNATTASLLKRAFMFLEDGDWNSANEYCEKVLDIDPENARAYLGKLMAELHVGKQEDLKNCAEPFDTSNNYQKAVRFADDTLRTALTGYLEHINTRNESKRLVDIYNRAKDVMASANTETAYREAASLFESVSDYLDSAALAQECHGKVKDAVLARGKAEMFGTCKWRYEKAIKLFESVSGWKDADEQVYICQKKIEEITAREEIERECEAELALREAKRAKRKKKAILLTVGAVIALIIVLVYFIIPNSKYNDAIALMETGNIVEAYEALIALDGYKDSAEKALSIRFEYEIEKIKMAKVGDHVSFGTYEQDNDTSNGKESVEWRVLEIKDGRVLVISRYSLDCKQYNKSNTGVTWETCTLRKWLNDEFVNFAFSDEEKAMIPVVTVAADNDSGYDTNPGNATQDQVFLLSITETNQYFRTNSERICQPTAYAVANGAYERDSSLGWWWLRSPGYRTQNTAAGIKRDGWVYDGVYSIVSLDSGGEVRPVLWIDLNS